MAITIDRYKVDLGENSPAFYDHAYAQNLLQRRA